MIKRFRWLNEESTRMLHSGYLLPKESVDGAVKRITESAAKQLKQPHMAKQFQTLIENGWISLSSPIWSNMGTERGLPISCFNSHIPDSMQDILYKVGEVGMMTKVGGGTSGYFGELRPRGASIKDNGTSSGPLSFMKLFDTSMVVISQGNVRRGGFAAYLDIDHEDIHDFLKIKNVGSPIQNLFSGVCIPDYWMNEMIEGDADKRATWAKVLQSRKEKGLPYLFFTDNVNKNKPQVYKDKSMSINSSNLCSEIMLPSSKNESFVCCLLSMNLEYYDEWKDTDAVQLAIRFLDAVMSEFIEKSESHHYLKAAHKFAKRHRALGLGVLGMWTYFQKHMIDPESIDAKQHTSMIFAKMKKEALISSKQLAEEFGEPELLKGYGLRNTTLLAIAPTTSSSSILGQASPGIEPYKSNYFKAGLAKGNFMRRNKFLKELLIEKGHDNEDIWRSILAQNGSVQHLDIFSQHEKNVFKTFKELSQLTLIQLASIRQRFVDQGQSLNLNIPPSMTTQDVNKLIITAWELGIKSLYYQRSESVSKEFLANMAECTSCEG